jgi:GH25 family lysozyme M1 (1,4-beta-N-acetylmuramidase)
MLYGIDISGYQPGIDLSVVPCDFVGIYLSGGIYSGNAHAGEQIQSAVDSGKRIMAYHFENDGTPGTVQQESEWFLTMIDHYKDLLPANTLYALDNETGNARNVAWQYQFCDTVRSRLGRPGVGMYGPFTNIKDGIYQPLRDNGFFIWESAYVLGDTRIDGYNVPGGRAPIPGGDPEFWQFTSTGYLPGWPGKLDLNVFLKGGAAEWDALAGATGTDASSVAPIKELTDDEKFFSIELGIPLPI